MGMRTIQDKTEETILIAEEDSVGQSLTLKGLKRCFVDIRGTLGALYIYGCDDCSIKVAYVKSACNIYRCKDGNVEVVCQQLRINETKNMTFEVLTKADPALVDSKNACFKRLKLTAEHKGLLGDNFDVFERSIAWKNVQDFQSLNGDITNFRIIE